MMRNEEWYESLNPLVLPIDLQWFAAEDEGRSEDPTEHKLREARKDGKVAKSADITSAAVLLFALVGLAALSDYMLKTFQEMLRYYLSVATEMNIATDRTIFSAFFVYFIKLTLPVMAVAFVAAALGNILQVGWLFTAKPITPDFKRVAPDFGKWFQRMFSAEGLFTMIKSIVKIAVIAIIAFVMIKSEADVFKFSVHRTLAENFGHLATTSFKLMVITAILLLALSIPDYFFQRWQHRESLKMTKHEIKEEYKQYEGDPLIRSRLKQRMQEILQANMLRNVPKADVVITNPTHFAVALEYDRAKMPAPMVTAKGQDNMALRIREIAAENGIPVIENKPLARALHANVEIGDIVPEEYWEVVSLILAEVYRMNGRAV
jgi:flagellar biosynthetic protein FlhB